MFNVQNCCCTAVDHSAVVPCPPLQQGGSGISTGGGGSICTSTRSPLHASVTAQHSGFSTRSDPPGERADIAEEVGLVTPTASTLAVLKPEML
jgi:hypothetical protein